MLANVFSNTTPARAEKAKGAPLLDLVLSLCLYGRHCEKGQSRSAPGLAPPVRRPGALPPPTGPRLAEYRLQPRSRRLWRMLN
jgi:hypothetical protein